MMIGPMPSPIGHALAGVATALMGERDTPASPFTPERLLTPDLKVGPTESAAKRPTMVCHNAMRGRRVGPVSTLTVVCAVLAMLPDIDLLYLPLHRTATHSVFAALLIFIVAASVTGWVTGRVSWRVAIVCGAAYGSHILCDWMGKDASIPHGIQALWPFSDRWFISQWPLFPGTERRQVFSERSILINLWALVAELAIFGPVVVALWLRRTRRSRGPISGQGGRQQPSA